MDQRCFKAKGLDPSAGRVHFGGLCNDSSDAHGSVGQVGEGFLRSYYALGSVLYAQSGNLDSIDQEIVNIGDRANEAVEKLPSLESKSYLLVEARAKIDGLNAFRNDIEKGGANEDRRTSGG